MMTTGKQKNDTEECRVCNGTGKIEKNGWDKQPTGTFMCMACMGTGKVKKAK
jgi:DnaJ-class molecular chaperone